MGNPLQFGAVNAGTNLTTRLSTATAASGSFTGGIASIAAPLAISRGAAADGPYTALQIGIAPTDSDGVRMGPYNLNVGGSLDRTSIMDVTVQATTEVRWGRIKMGNAYGSELLQLPIPVTAQFWDGTSFVTNILDGLTQFNTNINPAGNIVPTIVSSPLALANVSVVTPGAVAFVRGIRTFTLSRPGVSGSVDLSMNAPGYLLPSITGRATFGVYKGNSDLIYQRERY